jgi:hypothetical protein
MNLDALKKFHNPEKDGTLVRINEFLKSKYNAPLTYAPKPTHKPSELGSKCFRKIYYSYYKVPRDTKIDAKGSRIFETGNFYEAMVMSWFIGMGEHIPYRNKDGVIPKHWATGEPNPQFPITVPDWRVNKGYIDNVAIVDGELWLYEIKSSASHKFNDLNGPMDDHKVQIATYFKAFNDHLVRGDFSHIPELAGHTKAAGVKVLYVNKDTSDLELFTLRSEALERQVKLLQGKITVANEFIDKKELPPKTEDKCSYCPFKKKCAKDWNGV